MSSELSSPKFKIAGVSQNQLFMQIQTDAKKVAEVRIKAFKISSNGENPPSTDEQEESLDGRNRYSLFIEGDTESSCDLAAALCSAKLASNLGISTAITHIHSDRLLIFEALLPLTNFDLLNSLARSIDPNFKDISEQDANVQCPSTTINSEVPKQSPVVRSVISRDGLEFRLELETIEPSGLDRTSRDASLHTVQVNIRAMGNSFDSVRFYDALLDTAERLGLDPSIRTEESMPEQVGITFEKLSSRITPEYIFDVVSNLIKENDLAGSLRVYTQYSPFNLKKATEQERRYWWPDKATQRNQRRFLNTRLVFAVLLVFWSAIWFRFNGVIFPQYHFSSTNFFVPLGLAIFSFLTSNLSTIIEVLFVTFLFWIPIYVYARFYRNPKKEAGKK